MTPRKRFITCEICGYHASRINHNKRVFMAKFPLDEDRCRQWVKVTGKEDLIYVPIEKLHTLKYLCGNHFEDEAFNKKKNRLKKTAVPSKNLNADPLPDEMMVEFPSHINVNVLMNSEFTEISHNETFISQVETLAGFGAESFWLHQQLQSRSGQGFSDKNVSTKRNRSPRPGKSETDHTYDRKEGFDHSYAASTSSTLGNIKINHGHAKDQGESSIHTVTSKPTPPGTRARDDDNIEEGDIRLGLRLDEKDSDGENNNHTVHINYPISDTEGGDDDDSGNAASRSQPAVASKAAVFSWNKKADIVPHEDDDGVDLYEIADDTDDVIMYEQDSSQGPNKQNDDAVKEIDTCVESKKQDHEGFQCNCCENSIIGYRYSCVQCPDYDLCSACESRGVHALHYMLRIPGPRPYEEVQSMLELIRRQLLQSEIILKPGDASKRALYSEDGIKLEAKDEVEEVDPFQYITQPESGSPLFAHEDVFECPEQEEDKETDAECTIYLPSETVSRDLASVSQQKRNPHKVKLQDSDESDDDSTTNLPLKNSESKQVLINWPTHKRTRQDSDESDEETIVGLTSVDVPFKHTSTVRNTYFTHKTKPQSPDPEEFTTDFLSGDISSKPSCSYQPTHFRHKGKLQESITELSSENVSSILPSTVKRTYVPLKIKHPHQIQSENANPKVLSQVPLESLNQKKVIQAENYGIRLIENKNSKVVLPKIPLELLNQKVIQSSSMPNVTSADNIQSEEKSGTLMVTPEYLGLSESDLIKQFNLEVQGRSAKRILIQVDNKVCSKLVKKSGEKSLQLNKR